MSNPLPAHPEVIRVECSACRGLGYTDATAHKLCDKCDRGVQVFDLAAFRDRQLVKAERDARRVSLDPFEFGGELSWEEYDQDIEDGNECLRLGLTPDEVEAEERRHAERWAAREASLTAGSPDDDIPW